MSLAKRDHDAAMGVLADQTDDMDVTGELLRDKRREAGLMVKEPREMNAKVVSVIAAATGKFGVMSGNRQIWRQEEARDFPLSAGDIVVVTTDCSGPSG